MGNGSWLDVDRSAEVKLVNMYADILKGSRGGRDGSGKSDRIATVEMFKEIKKGIMTMSP